jgi:hypothetical protein
VTWRRIYLRIADLAGKRWPRGNTGAEPANSRRQLLSDDPSFKPLKDEGIPERDSSSK